MSIVTVGINEFSLPLTSLALSVRYALGKQMSGFQSFFLRENEITMYLDLTTAQNEGVKHASYSQNEQITAKWKGSNAQHYF